jgi:hypothetical protein
MRVLASRCRGLVCRPPARRGLRAPVLGRASRYASAALVLRPISAVRPSRR